MFAYCGNNPVARKDNGGHAWLNAMAIGVGVGAVSGIAGQLITDLTTSSLSGQLKISSWQTYVGAAIGGAAGGATLALTGSMNAANAVTGAVTTGASMALEKVTNSSYEKNWGEIGAMSLIDGMVGFGLGMIPGFNKITSGRNNMSAVYKAGLTKLRNNTATKMAQSVIAKGIKSSIVGGLALDVYYGIKQCVY